MAWPISLDARAGAPRPQPGPGPPKLRDRACPPGPFRWPDRDPPSDRIRRSPGRLARNKRTNRPRRPKTLASFLSLLSLSLRLLFVALSSLSTASTERRPSNYGGGARHPWRRRRPPRRRACSPTGEHAAVERPGHGAPLVESGEQLPPGSALHLPRRRRAILTHGEVCLLFPFSDLSYICFLFFSLVHPKRRSRVRVRLNPIRVFFWFDSRSLRLSPSPLPLLFF